jgi:RimJ/RimL family protein N-acetyltransferase
MILQGNGFILRGWLPGDAEALALHANNPNIATCLLDKFPSPYTLEAAQAWVKQWEHQNPVINFALAINGQIAGGVGLELREDIHRLTPLIGYWLAEPYWGKGIMPEAVSLVTRYAFSELNAICVLGIVFSKNPQSMRVLEKAGYEKQGIIKRSVIKEGEILDQHIYACSR